MLKMRWIPGVLCVLLASAGMASAQPLPPGFVQLDMPMTVDIRDGVNTFFFFAVAGDVVLFESPNGSLTNPASWSDVVQFRLTANGTTATLISDLESGFPANFVLDANHVGILEVQTGAGTENDVTPYTAGTNLYLIHSDAAGNEIPEPGEGVVPEPSTLALLGIGSLGLLGYAYRRRRQAM